MQLKPVVAIISSLMAFQTHASVITELDGISVTATRSAETISQQPLSIAKKGAEEKQLDQAIFQKDVLNSVAGVSVKQTGSVIGHTIAVRMPNSTLPYYLYLQDNVPVQSSGFFNHNAMAYTNYQTAGTAEILKGAGTALYGSDSVAATINVQSPTPALEIERKVNGYVGSDGFFQGGVSVSDTLEEGSSYRVAGSASKSDGWRDHTNMKRQELSAEYNFSQGNDDFKVSLTSNYSHAQQADSFSSLAAMEADPTLAGDADYYTNLTKIDAMRQFDHNRVSLEWDNYSVANLDLSTIFYLRNTRNQYTATWQDNLPHNNSEENTFGIMHKGLKTADWGRLIYGVDTEVTKGTRTYTQQFDYDASLPTGTIYDYAVDYLALSPYLHSDFNVADKTTLSAGLRYDANHYQYKNNTADGQYETSTYFRVSDRNDSYSHLSPKLALSYALTPKSTVYARYANGFRVPSASRLYNLKTNNVSFTLNPETTNTYELGYKVDGKTTDVEVALYYMDLADTITQYTDGGGNKYYDNGATTLHKGVELTVKHDINKQWAAKAAYSYSLHNYDNDAKYDNNYMAQAPEHQLNLRMFYRPKNLAGLVVMAEAVYNSDYWMDAKNTTKYSGYRIYNLKADYQLDKQWRVYAKVDNLTDELYAESASKVWSASYTPGAPRQVFIGTELKW